MPSVGENWKCPYCDHAQVISESRRYADAHHVSVSGWKYGKPRIYVEAIVCSNSQCCELSLGANLNTYTYTAAGREHQGPSIHRWGLLPKSHAKVLPDYIPQAIRQDYEEACLIRELSPKAAATIIRRCLQGMIRDFCEIKERNLAKAIRKLRARVDAGKAPQGVQSDTVDAIDHVRNIGNIGAHMETNIDIIVDVDPNEAQKLIELTELLFEEWYIARKKRAEKLEGLGLIAADKKLAKKGPPQNEVVENAKGGTETGKQEGGVVG